MAKKLVAISVPLASSSASDGRQEHANAANGQTTKSITIHIFFTIPPNRVLADITYGYGAQRTFAAIAGLV